MDAEQSPADKSPRVTLPARPGRRLHLTVNLSRTSSAFVAEYSVMLFALAGVISNLVWLVYGFFNLIIDAAHGGVTTSVATSHMFMLWLGVSSLVLLPATYILWRRTQGELAANAEFKSELPKGGAKGLRTFWLTVAGLALLGTVFLAIFAPLASLAAATSWTDALIGVTIPALINVAVIGAGIYMVAGKNRKLITLLFGIIIAVSAVLCIANYAWASSERQFTPMPTPISYPVPTSPYDGVYNY